MAKLFGSRFLSQLVEQELSTDRAKFVREENPKMPAENFDHSTSSITLSSSDKVQRMTNRFWMLNRSKQGQWHIDKDGLCQCGTEDVINRSADPGEMRAFLMVSVFVDQMIYTHYQLWYREFRAKRRFPKLYSHGGYGMMSASWLVYPGHDYNLMLDWGRAQSVASSIVVDLFLVMNTISSGQFDKHEFYQISKHEIIEGFHPLTSGKFLNLLWNAEVTNPRRSMARRMRCKDFDIFEPLFETIQKELDQGTRKIRSLDPDSLITNGDFISLNNQIIYIAEEYEGIGVEVDQRGPQLRVIYDDGTERNISPHLLLGALKRGQSGGLISNPDAGPLFSR
jgi:hypothetical protein